MKPLIVNADLFGGIFPHKGERCVRINPMWGSSGKARWIPVKGREIVVAQQRYCSEGYVPAECLPEEFLRTLAPHQIWRGQVGEQRFVWKRDLPARGIRLVKAWRSYECSGPNTYYFTVPAGTVIFCGNGGTAAQAGYHWEV